MKKRPLIVLEPALEEIAGAWGILECLRGMKVYSRWLHQLKMKVAILRALRAREGKRPGSRPLRCRRADLN